MKGKERRQGTRSRPRRPTYALPNVSPCELGTSQTKHSPVGRPRSSRPYSILPEVRLSKVCRLSPSMLCLSVLCRKGEYSSQDAACCR